MWKNVKGKSIKDVASGCYLNIANNYIHAGGPYGGVNCIDYAENDNQIFMFEASGNNYYLKSKSGYYIYCQQWNVDGLTYGSELTFIDNSRRYSYISPNSKKSEFKLKLKSYEHMIVDGERYSTIVSNDIGFTINDNWIDANWSELRRIQHRLTNRQQYNFIQFRFRTLIVWFRNISNDGLEFSKYTELI